MVKGVRGDAEHAYEVMLYGLVYPIMRKEIELVELYPMQFLRLTGGFLAASFLALWMAGAINPIHWAYLVLKFAAILAIVIVSLLVGLVIVAHNLFMFRVLRGPARTRRYFLARFKVNVRACLFKNRCPFKSTFLHKMRIQLYWMLSKFGGQGLFVAYYSAVLYARFYLLAQGISKIIRERGTPVPATD
jgi:hypothetical protein